MPPPRPFLPRQQAPAPGAGPAHDAEEPRLTDEEARRFPPGLLDTLTPSQRAAIRSLIRTSARRHAIDYRVSFPTGIWGAWYLVILAGRERRNAARLADEGQTSLRRRTVLISAILLLGLMAALFGVLCALYIVKSLLGIDLFPGPSPLHALYELIRGRGAR